MATATLGIKGQIIIPLVVRQRLGVNAGDRVHFIENAYGQFVLVPATADMRSLKSIVPRPERPLSVDDMGRIIASRGTGK